MAKMVDRAELVRCVKLASEVVDETLPVPAPGKAASERQDRVNLRQIAFASVLGQIMEHDVE
jgi:hypothetical protein